VILPLERLKRGESATIADVSGNQGWVSRLEELGIRAGVRVTMVQPGSPALVEAGSGRFSLRLGDAIRILVETGNGDPQKGQGARTQR
jgi:Fe2+ transport system protein FeoA